MSIQVPDFFAIRDQIAANLIAVFGPDLNVEPNSPTGQIIDLISNSYLQLYQLASGIDSSAKVTQAQGQQLTDLVSLLNVFRTAGTFTTVSGVTLTGTAGTVVPVNSEASTSSGTLFHTNFEVTLAGGTAVVDFTANQVGASVIDVGALNTVVSAVTGWTGVNNTVAGITGLDTESDKSLRVRHQNLLGQFSLGYLGAITSAAHTIVQVLDIVIYENDTTGPLPPPINSPSHTLWPIIYYEDASTEQQLAEVLFAAKGAVAFSSEAGPTQVQKVVTDIANQGHTVSWNRATTVPLYVEVEFTQLSQLTSDVINLAKAALVAYIKDTQRIGARLYYNGMLCAIAEVDPAVEVSKFFVSKVNPPTPADIVDILAAFDEIFTLDDSDIVVTIVP
jgi:uncharacterized phage protein gp47/JayE